MFLYVSLCKNAFLIRPVGKLNKSGGVWYSGVHHKFQAGKWISIPPQEKNCMLFVYPPPCFFPTVAAILSPLPILAQLLLRCFRLILCLDHLDFGLLLFLLKEILGIAMAVPGSGVG